MLDVYYLARNFVNVLATSGAYLIEYNFSDLCLYLTSSFDLPERFLDFLSGVEYFIGDFTVSSLVFGYALIFIIVFKIVKFFTDIVL